jgi:hypothetical protein
MGYSLSWLAVKGKSPQAVREELGFRATGQREEVPESDLSAAEMPTGWYLIVSNRSEQVISDSEMQRLSSSGCELVTCFVEEHVMFSAATGWKEGRKCWSVSHDAGRGMEHLAFEGELPPAFASIRDELIAKRREKGSVSCDYIFDIPVATAQSLTGYWHDRDVPGLDGEPFEVLERPLAQSSPPERKPSFWKRLFGT